MATNDVENRPHTNVIAAEAGVASPGATGMIDAVNNAHQGFHPFYSIVGLMGYGRYGTLRRKHLFTLAFKMLLGVGQIVSIIALSVISSKTMSPTRPDRSEWDVCDRPLGAWVILWAVRVALGLVISIYSFILIRPGLVEFTFDPEHDINTDAVQANATPPPVGPLNGPGQPQFVHAGRIHRIPRILQSITTILSFLSLVWFIAAHILVYTSIGTCRKSSPHLWWLAFGIMSIAYLLIAEVLLVVFFLFFFVPVLLLMINIILLCLGRQPLFRPGGANHEIGKLPQQVVNRIPLVLYIPSPPQKEGKDPISKEQSHTYPPATDSPVVTIAPPPKDSSATPAPLPVEQKKRHRFFFFHRKGKQTEPEGSAGTEGAPPSHLKRKGTEDAWEQNWERGDYPFVKLPENRATCAICLLDFEEPPRRNAGQKPAGEAVSASTGGPSQNSGKQLNGNAPSTSVPVESLALQDAGEGATPLRLLACGHAFHQTCLDPWLKDVSGRCPVCQKAVDIEELERLSKKGKSTSWATKAVTPTGEPSSSGLGAQGPGPDAGTDAEGQSSPP